MLEVLNSEGFRQIVQGLGGYDITEMGRIRTAKESF